MSAESWSSFAAVATKARAAKIAMRISDFMSAVVLACKIRIIRWCDVDQNCIQSVYELRRPPREIFRQLRRVGRAKDTSNNHNGPDKLRRGS